MSLFLNFPKHPFRHAAHFAFDAAAGDVGKSCNFILQNRIIHSADFVSFFSSPDMQTGQTRDLSFDFHVRFKLICHKKALLSLANFCMIIVVGIKRFENVAESLNLGFEISAFEHTVYAGVNQNAEIFTDCFTPRSISHLCP